MVPTSLMQVLVAIGPQATLHTTGPYYVSEQCPGLTASCFPKTKSKGLTPNQRQTVRPAGARCVRHPRALLDLAPR